MYRANLEIVLRNGNVIGVGFEDDEVVNSLVERLKKAIAEDTVFSLDMTNNATVPPTSVVHYVPTREIVRFAVIQHPRPAVAAR